MKSRNGIRVLMVDSESTWRGGERQLELLMRGLVSEGFAVSLAAPALAEITGRARRLEIPCLDMPAGGGRDLLGAWRLRRYVGSEGADIIHCHSSRAHGIAFMATRAVGRSFGSGRRPTPPIVVSRRVDFPGGRSPFSALKYRRGADIFLAISLGVQEVLVRSGIDPSRIELVRSGIDLENHRNVRDTAYLASEFSLKPGVPVIGNVAALAPHKSQEDFITAAKLVEAEIREARFFIVGEGERRKKLERLIREIGMEDKITLTGFRQDALEILSIFDCFVLSSVLEGLCTSVMDSQALGVPVVATAAGGVPELVEHEVTGLLAPPGRPELLAGAIVRMLRDRALRERCREAARRKAESYDYHRTVRKTVDAYFKVLGNRGIPQ